MQEKKPEDEPEEGHSIHRKMSHNEFYERSPRSKDSDKEDEEHSPKIGRARSEFGDV